MLFLTLFAADATATHVKRLAPDFIDPRLSENKPKRFGLVFAKTGSIIRALVRTVIF
jgi:hypothetical protein